MSSFYGSKGATDTDFRRKFNKEDYEQRRLEKEQEASSSRTLVPPDQRSNLKARDFKMILDSKLNKTVIVTANAPKSQQAGYYCEVCDVVLRDSNSFLDHMNSKKHQLKLGMNMKVERATVSQVKDKLESLKRKKTSAETYDFKARVEQAEEEEEERKRQKKELAKEKKKNEDDEQANAAKEAFGDVDPAMAAMMGFGGFGTTKK